MKITRRKLSGVFEISLEPHEDKRGFFIRTYAKDVFDKYGIDRNWVQENHSRSVKKSTVRGLHFQFPPHSETKLVRCVRGAVLDVFVDLRKNSPCFGQWDSIELSENNHRMIYIPRGFAHGFCTLADNCDILYKTDNFYEPNAEGGIIWNDRTLNIKWPVDNPILSIKDANLPTFDEFVSRYIALTFLKG